ncbi:MAG TPA: DNA alkylation repair protein [Candidatus Moranbacteria bacterium]|nr:DNA alkylation repair protein [Candidatus Moranbacteria bacterium]
MGTVTIAKEVLRELNELSKNPDNIKDYSRFHKDGKSHISLATPIVRKLSAEKFKKIKHLDKKQILEYCEDLLKFKNSSCRDIAFDWAFRIRKNYSKEDFAMFEKWLDEYVDTWGSCDDLCTHALGYYLFAFPEFISQIHHWTKSKNKWKRRASAVVFIYSARQNKYLNDILKIAKTLLLDREDLVQKAYGWMLKESSNVNQQEIFEFVMKHKSTMSRTALRYAIEKMSTNLKKQAMLKP